MAAETRNEVDTDRKPESIGLLPLTEIKISAVSK